MLRRLTCAVFGKKGSDLIRNHDIIFDVVRVVDKRGLFVGEMATSEGIKLAKAKGLDLILVDFKSDPPLCQISDSVQQSPEGRLLDSQGYSFDPTLRPATIRFSAGIDELELDRKIDILRKHLLEKRRCEVIVYLKEKQQTLEPEKVRDLLVRILRDCEDVSKSPDYFDATIEAGEVKIHVWPCNPDQTEQLQKDMIEIASEDLQVDEPELAKKGHPRKFRTIRSRVDPRLLIYEKHYKPPESE